MTNKFSMMKILDEQDWNRWLMNPIRDEYEDVWKTHEWVKSLCIDGIIPLLQKQGYVLNMSRDKFVNCMMNYMYRWYNRNKKGYISCTYSCKCNKHSGTSDDEWYFHSVKMEYELWENLKKMFFIEDYADDSEFSYRLWNDMPYYVYRHLDIENSPATITLDNMLSYEDDEEESDNDGNRSKTDPYVADYA